MVHTHKPIARIIGIGAALALALGPAAGALAPAHALGHNSCFKTSSAASLRGVTWVSDLNSGAVINFGPDGVDGNDSCNVFGGNYKVVGNLLSFDRVIMTMRYCYENQATQRAFGRMFNSTSRFTVHYLWNGKRKLVVEPLGAKPGAPITFTSGIKTSNGAGDGVER